MNKLLVLFKKYKSIILYLVFGVLTTAVNVVTYHIFYNILKVSNVLSTSVAWMVSVLFAYFTNRIFVFEQKETKFLGILKELSLFFLFRILTGILDVLIMYVTVNVLNFNALLWKLISNIIVIVLNYIVSKLIVFKKTSE